MRVVASAPVSTEFVMHGARAAMASGLSHIEEQVKGIERAVVENPGLAFDLAKTVVESACRTILTVRKIAFESDEDLSRLFKTVTTKRINAIRQTPGAPVWQRDFWDHVIRDEFEMNTIRTYIANNIQNWSADEFNRPTGRGAS